MAKNSRKGFRRGAVKHRSQTRIGPKGPYVKRDRATGQFMDVKVDNMPFKGVTKEK